MTQIATVTKIFDNMAEIEVSRKAMCDGCHKTSCGQGCPMSGIFSSGKSMSAIAENKVDAKVGDTVEIETSDKEVLTTAVIVFLIPIICGFVFFSVASLFNLSSHFVAAVAVMGFIIPFPFFKLVEVKSKKKGTKIVITKVISSQQDNNK